MGERGGAGEGGGEAAQVAVGPLQLLVACRLGWIQPDSTLEEPDALHAASAGSERKVREWSGSWLATLIVVESASLFGSCRPTSRVTFALLLCF